MSGAIACVLQGHAWARDGTHCTRCGKQTSESWQRGYLSHRGRSDAARREVSTLPGAADDLSQVPAGELSEVRSRVSWLPWRTRQTE